MSEKNEKAPRRNRRILILDAMRGVSKNFVSFLSIIAIMMLGVGGLLGILNLGSSLRHHADAYYRERNYKDFEVISSLGVEQKDIDELCAIEGVKAAEGFYRFSGVLKKGEEISTVTLISPTERISVPSLVEGKMPEEQNECALNRAVMDLMGLEIGDEVKLIPNGMPELLEEETFVVTGEMMHPDYIAAKEYAVLIPVEGFNLEMLDGRYPVAYVKADIPEKTDVFSLKYRKELSDVKKRLDTYISETSVRRTEEIRERARKIYEAKEAEADERLKEGEQELKDAEAELKKGLDEAWKRITDGEKEIEEGEKTLEKELAKAEEELNQAAVDLENQVAQKEREIADAQRRADEEFEAARLKLEEGEASYADMKGKFDEGIETRNSLLDDGRDYVVVTNAICGNVRDIFPEAEKKFPDLVKNEDWKDFTNAVNNGYDKTGSYLEEDHNAQMRLVRDLYVDINEKFEKLPHKEELKNDFQEAFNAAREAYPEESEKLMSRITVIKTVVETDFEDYERRLQAGREELDSNWEAYRQKITEVQSQLNEAGLKLLTAKKENEDKIKEAWKEYYKVKAQKITELENAKESLAQAKMEYYKTKAEKEKELEDGRVRFEVLKMRVERQLNEGKAQMESLDDDNFIANPRSLTTSFLHLDTTIRTISIYALIFVPLFCFIAGLVCFSTIAIIVEDQRSEIGAVKALGFYNREIDLKYIIFSLLGTAIGNITGILLGLFLSSVLNKPVCGSYNFGEVKNQISIIPMVAAVLLTFGLAVSVTRLATRNMLKCSAIGLINGSEPVKKTMKGSRKGKKAKEGKLYSSLIFNNMLMDYKRVAVSIVVIAGSCAIVGMGFTVRHDYKKTMEEQLNEINDYTIQVVFDDKSMNRYDAVKKMVEEKGGRYLECAYTEGLIHIDGEAEGFILISADKNEIEEFIHLKDIRKNTVTVPDDGILLPRKVVSRLGGREKVNLWDKKLYSHSAKVADEYLWYLGCVGISDKETYGEIYGKEYEPNCLYIKLEGMSEEEAENAVMNISEDVRLLRRDYLLEKGDSVNALLDAVTVMCLGLSVLLTFMIMVNMTNILVRKRMKEILVMRVNGFSLAEVIGYVGREAVAILTAGLIVGISFGVGFSYMAIVFMENIHVLYVRLPYVWAWVISVVLNVLFAVLIDSFSFGKIKKTVLTDIMKYK